MTIFDAKKEDEGSYSCVATNRLGEEWSHFHLTIAGETERDSLTSIELQTCIFVGPTRSRTAPEVTNHPASTLALKEKDQVLFPISVRGHPEPRVFFYHNGKLLKSNETVRIGKNTTLWHLLKALH